MVSLLSPLFFLLVLQSVQIRSCKLQLLHYKTYVYNEAVIFIWVFGLTGATPINDKTPTELGKINAEQNTVSRVLS